jgi:hypothetical protein
MTIKGAPEQAADHEPRHNKLRSEGFHSFYSSLYILSVVQRLRAVSVCEQINVDLLFTIWTNELHRKC